MRGEFIMKQVVNEALVLIGSHMNCLIILIDVVYNDNVEWNECICSLFQYVNEETSGEYAAQYPQPQNDPIYEKLMYEGRQRQNWAQPPAESQVLDVPAEILKLNECKCFAWCYLN